VSWRNNIQILDLEASDRLELTCRKCGTFRWLTGTELQARKGKERLTLGEVESRARCRQRGCGGAMRMAMPAPHDTAGFVGGIA
jgi:hypothetical protein